MTMKIKTKDQCRWDLVSLGEVMLRLDPGDGRIATTRQFQAWEGGGEYNVSRGLKRCFGMDTAVVTALADNAVGRLIQDLMFQGGVNLEHIRWVPYDGVGRAVRNGLNFTERGFGVRAALGCSDRGHTAVSQLKVGDVDWEKIFVQEGARWFHTGGIFSALSETTPQVAREAMDAARRSGTIVSYDLNYRPSLWSCRRRKGQSPGSEFSACSFRGRDVRQRRRFHRGVRISSQKRQCPARQSGSGKFQSHDPRRSAGLPAILRSRHHVTSCPHRHLNDWSAIAYCEGRFYSAPNAKISKFMIASAAATPLFPDLSTRC